MLNLFKIYFIYTLYVYVTSCIIMHNYVNVFKILQYDYKYENGELKI